MSTSTPDRRPLARSVQVLDEELTVCLVDGRRVTVPLAWFPRLRDATHAQRRHWELLGQGEGIRWPDVDEDLSVEGILAGTHAPGARSGRSG